MQDPSSGGRRKELIQATAATPGAFAINVPCDRSNVSCTVRLGRLMQTSGIEDVLDAFLAALGDPEGGTALHALHSTDALVRYPEGIGRAGAIEPGSFASRHRDLSLEGRDTLPR